MIDPKNTLKCLTEFAIKVVNNNTNVDTIGNQQQQQQQQQINANYCANYSASSDSAAAASTYSNNTSTCLNYQKTFRLIQEEISIIWIIFGTLGNIMSLIVLTRPKMRIHSTFTYLTLLAICDTLVVYFGLFRDYLLYKHNIDINGTLFCKFHVFSFYFLLHMASWLLVAVNIDRLIAASFLTFSKIWCTPRKAIIVSLCIGLTIALINCHLLYYVKSIDSINIPTSLVSSTTEQPLTTTTTTISTTKRIVTTRPPSSSPSAAAVVALLTNSTILSKNRTTKQTKTTGTKLTKSKTTTTTTAIIITTNPSTLATTSQIFEDLSNSIEPVNPFVYRKCVIESTYHKSYFYFFQNIFTWIDTTAQVILPFIVMLVCNINIIQKVLITKRKTTTTKGKNSKRLRKIKGMCVMIVTVSIIFFILELPVLIFICLIQGQWVALDSSCIEVFWILTNLMMYTNHVINFMLYCITGTKFRREFLKITHINKLIQFGRGIKRKNNYVDVSSHANFTHTVINHHHNANINHPNNNNNTNTVINDDKTIVYHYLANNNTHMPRKHAKRKGSWTSKTTSTTPINKLINNSKKSKFNTRHHNRYSSYRRNSSINSIKLKSTTTMNNNNTITNNDSNNNNNNNNTDILSTPKLLKIDPDDITNTYQNDCNNNNNEINDNNIINDNDNNDSNNTKTEASLDGSSSNSNQCMSNV